MVSPSHCSLAETTLLPEKGQNSAIHGVVVIGKQRIVGELLHLLAHMVHTRSLPVEGLII